MKTDFTSQHRRELLEAYDLAKRILASMSANIGVWAPERGICYNLMTRMKAAATSTRIVTYALDVMFNHFQSLDVKSFIYPIDGSEEFYRPGNKWEGERGDKRRKMCRDLVAVFDAKIKELS